VPFFLTVWCSLLASSSVVVSGFSHITPMPAAEAAAAGPKWKSLGVTMVT
jgi:hypothetical protein